MYNKKEMIDTKLHSGLTRLSSMLKKEREHNGLIGFGFTASMNVNSNDLANEIVDMHETYLNGEFVDITNRVL